MKLPQTLRRPAAWMVALAMILTLLPPVTLTAHAFTYYDIHIGNTSFSSENLTITDENGGTATFDPDTNTLTLTDFTYEGVGFKDNTLNAEGALYSTLESLTILLSGSSTLTNVVDGSDISYGLYSRGPVTIDVLPGAEYGRLVLNGGTATYSYGLKTDRSLIVNGGTLDTTGGEAPYNTGIYTGYNLIVNDGMVLANCKAATTLSYGINTYAYDKDNEAYNGGIYMRGGSIYAQTTEAPTCIAINSNHTITITDGFVSATGGTAGNGSCGISAAALISVQGGEVTATGGTSSNSSYGIIASDIFSLDGGKVMATGTAAPLGYGIAAQNGIQLNSGTMTAQGVGGAMSHAPMADSYDHFSFWYGTDEASAMAAGVKPGSLIPDYCGKPYVHFTDDSDSGDNGTDTPDTEGLIFSKVFPDPVFRAYVTDTVLAGSSEDKSHDAIITDAQMETIRTCLAVTVSNTENLTSLQGLEYFTGLKYLYCQNLAITELDISKNTALESLNCENSPITALDVSSNTALTNLSCYGTAITALDVSACTKLTNLHCYNTAITSLDVSQNTALERLSCYRTNITKLNVSSNTALKQLQCHETGLKVLDVSKNTALEQLHCYNTSIVELDVSANTALKLLNCHTGVLTALNVRYNTNLTTCNAWGQKPTKTDVLVMENNGVWTLDMAAFIGDNANIDYVTMTDGGVLENGIVTYTAKPETVTYTYDIGKGDMDVTWEPVFAEAHTHSYGTPSFDWASDLSYAGVTAICETCGDTQMLVDYPHWSEVSEGRLVKTAEVTLDGITYSENLVITAERSGNTVTLHLPNLVFAEQIVVAGYNEAGQMTECQITCDYSTTMTFTVTAPEVRIFFLDLSLFPYNPRTPALIV